MSASEIVNKVWNYAHVLRDDGVGYGDYVEQITYLIFLKMADERLALLGEFSDTGTGTKVGEVSETTASYQSTPSPQPYPRGRGGSNVPVEFSWSRLVKLDGDDLEIQYRHTLESLGKQGGMLGTIFRKAQNKIQDPAKLERLIKMIEKEQWSTLPADVKGEIYEGLLERNAQDVKGGAGQYFTPRPLIEAMVQVMQPKATDTVADRKMINYKAGNKYRKFQPLDALAIHKKELNWLEKQINSPFNGKTVVVTHHGPHHVCQHPAYPVSEISTAFHSDLSKLIESSDIDIWAFGHTHANIDKVVFDTRIISNQAGYPGENVNGFDASNIIEV